ncbi:hypothetical protein IDH10_03045 [Pelagibacterales bacterium SAG-MED20]|nr:hypothetical protein [Pelagibacterales bacterium SAG-MED20]MDC1010887.1 hypothetical protein [Candidatus Pelagibacter sp.]
MKKKILLVIFLIFSLTFIFSKQILSKYYLYKFSNWVERTVTFDQLEINYPNFISIKGIKILNSNPRNFENIFEAEKIEINFNLKSLFFSDLVIINSLNIFEPKFFLEIIKKNSKILDIEGNLKEESQTYDDNMGIAKSINNKSSKKIWPEKKKDINFIILESTISDGTTYLKIPSIENSFQISLSDMQYYKFGNEKNYQHYKEILRVILYDIYARIKKPNLKKLLKKIYNL